MSTLASVVTFLSLASPIFPTTIARDSVILKKNRTSLYFADSHHPNSNANYFVCIVFRLKVPHLLVKDIQRPTQVAVDVERYLSTSKRKLVRHVDTLLLKLEDVSLNFSKMMRCMGTITLIFTVYSRLV